MFKIKQNKIKILIADDHEIFRLGLKTVIEKNPTYHVCAEASNGLMLVEYFLKFQPDIVISDHLMHNKNGLEALIEIKQLHSSAKTILISQFEDKGLIKSCKESNIDGYISKGDSITKIISAVSIVLSGGTYFTEKEDSLINEQKLDHSPFKNLTYRELQVLCLIASGYRNNDISNFLGISKKTLDNHRTNIYKKFNNQPLNEILRQAYYWNICKDVELPIPYKL